MPTDPSQQLQKCRPCWIQRVEERRVFVKHNNAHQSVTVIGKSARQTGEQVPMHMKPEVTPFD